MRAWKVLPLAAVAAACVEQPAARPPVTAPLLAAPATPADLYGTLFQAVQMRRIFADGKTFVDAVPRRDPAAIMVDYRAAPPADDAALKAFVLANFDVPAGRRPSRPAPSARRWPTISARCGRS